MLLCSVLSGFSRVQLFETPCTVASQAPLFMGFSRQEYWNGLLYPPPGDLPDPGIKPTSPSSPALQEDSLTLNHQGSPPCYSLVINGKGGSIWLVIGSHCQALPNGRFHKPSVFQIKAASANRIQLINHNQAVSHVELAALSRIPFH